MTSGAPPNLQLHTEGGRFEQVAFLGRGASGLVFRVRDRRSGAEVALKTLDQRDPEKLYRLKQEFRSLTGIRHPNLVKLYELFASGDECFFTMEWIDGVDFVRWVGARRDPLSGAALDRGALARFVAAARQLVHGLAALHGEGKLHRDVKPQNVLVDRDGRVVLLDFGFVRGFGRRVLANEQSEGAAGSLAYMAPEILWGKEATPESDWYGVGVLLYEALSGRPPFEGPPAMLIAGRPAKPVPPLSGVPDELNRMILALLAGEPGERWGARETLAVLEALSPAGAGAGGPVAPARGEAPFIGRAGELAELRAAYELVTPYQPVVVHVRGASGIGKSELLRRFLTQLEREEKVVVLRGRCHPHEAVPYRAFDGLIDALSLYLGGLSPEAVEALAPRHADALAMLFPVLGRVGAFARHAEGPSGELQEIRRRGFGALRDLFARLADRRRLVLWIDDAQWSDPDSAALARELFRPPDPPGVLFVLSYRAEDRDAAAALAPAESDERGSARTRVIEVGPLPEAETEKLAAELAGGGALDLAAIARESQGSPFFVDQLVRSIAAAGADGAPRAELGQVVESRLAQLSEPARLLLEVASVAGRPLATDVALEAAGLGAVAQMELINLQEERLLRSSADASAATVEVYHDRIGEALVRQLDAGAKRARHRGLAHALVKQPQPDAQALFRHYLGADEREPAAHWAVEAADRADAALAFAEAAETYGRALELIADETRRADLQVKRATALVNAGRGAEAAPIFMEAAGRVAGTESLELRRRGAEQYLVTGAIDGGEDAMQSLLSDLGLRYPRTALGAAAATGFRLLRIAAKRPARTRSWGTKPIGAADALRIEAARSAAKGLAMVDPFRGLYFAVLTLGLALHSRDPRRVARELAGVGATLLPAGGPTAGWAAALIDRGREMALELDDPYLIGLTSIMLAQKRMVEGRWREMLDLCDAGADLLRERCRGVSWELALAAGPAERALEELGDFEEMRRRGEEGLRWAESTSDFFRRASALLTIGLSMLARDKLEEAGALGERVRTLWTERGFHMQHFYGHRLEAYSFMGRGEPGRALERVESIWTDLERANLLRHVLIRTDAFLLRARTRLAVAESSPARRSELLAAVEGDVLEIERIRRCDAIGHAAAIRAAVSALRGDPDRTIALLRESVATFARAEMYSAEVIAQFRLNAVTGASTTENASKLFARGIVSAGRFVEMFAPALAPTST